MRHRDRITSVKKNKNTFKEKLEQTGKPNAVCDAVVPLENT